MIPFDASNPFPLLPEGRHSYAEAQMHSAEVDSWLGFTSQQIEDSIDEKVPGQQLWMGLPLKTLLTPYTEIREILHRVHLSPGATVVDLGAGYGRMAFVIGRHHPGVSFVGYEYVPERVIEANRCLQFNRAEIREVERLKLEVADLSRSDFQLISAELYFLYDYGTRGAIQKTLEDLKMIAASKRITVVGRGRASRDAIERSHPWLSQVTQPEHFAHYSIYRSS